MFIHCNICPSLSRPRAPLHWLDPGAFGTLGVGGGFALGAKLCRPDSDVWIIYGDGSLGYSVAEFDTFTRHKVMRTIVDNAFFYLYVFSIFNVLLKFPYGRLNYLFIMCL